MLCGGMAVLRQGIVPAFKVMHGATLASMVLQYQMLGFLPHEKLLHAGVWPQSKAHSSMVLMFVLPESRSEPK